MLGALSACSKSISIDDRNYIFIILDEGLTVDYLTKQYSLKGIKPINKTKNHFKLELSTKDRANTLLALHEDEYIQIIEDNKHSIIHSQSGKAVKASPVVDKK